MATEWYYALHGEQKGPVSTEVLMALVLSHQLSREDLVWKKGFVEWINVAHVPELAALPQMPSSPTPPTVTPDQGPEKSPESEELRLVPESEESEESQKPEQPSQTIVPQPAHEVASQAAQWYYVKNGQKLGPVTAQLLKEKALSGELLPTDYLWKFGLKDWVLAGSLPKLVFPVSKVQTPPLPQIAVGSKPLDPDDDPDDEPDDEPTYGIMDALSNQASPGRTATDNSTLQSDPFDFRDFVRNSRLFIAKWNDRVKKSLNSIGNFGSLLAAFLIPIPLAFVLAYFYGILRFQTGCSRTWYFLIWYFVIFVISAILIYPMSVFFEKARIRSQLLVTCYPLLLSAIVLYLSWGTFIVLNDRFPDALKIPAAYAYLDDYDDVSEDAGNTEDGNKAEGNDIPKKAERGQRVTIVESLIHPQEALLPIKQVYTTAMDLSGRMETSWSQGETTSSAVPFLVWEALFIITVPIFVAFKCYNP